MEAIQRNWGWFLALGIVWIILGALAILFPLVAGLALVVFVGWLFIIGGIVQFVHAFSTRGWSGFLLEAIGAILFVAAGVLLLLHPVYGIFTLTLILAVFFVVEGIFRTVAGFRVPWGEGRGWLIAGGVLGIVLGILIYTGLPTTAGWFLGLLVGIEFIFTGWSFVMIALSGRRSAPARAATA
jgi:uncharacterized membrane protein HdeD (DUF308 family)